MPETSASKQTGRARPRFLRALGRAEAPLRIVVDGQTYEFVESLKHDSWAATAVYRGPAGKITCKFNRQQSIFVIPMKWLGRRLARREAWFLAQLTGHPNVPRLCGPVTADGRVLDNAVAHDWIEGHPLARGERVNDDFFPQLRSLIETMHERGMAYVDLHKPENIIVGEDERPYLIDFQISYRLPRSWLGRVWPFTAYWRAMKGSDIYHLYKHICRNRPDLLPEGERDPVYYRPGFNRFVRKVGNPMRKLRRSVLVLLGVRRGRGRSHSEIDPEDAVRRQRPQRP